MAPLPVNNTERWFLDYQVAGVNHTLMVRVESPSDNATMSTFFSDLFDALDTKLYAVTISGLRVSHQGSDISTDEAYIGTTGFGAGSPDDLNKGAFLGFQGRSTAGRRVKLNIFGFSDLGNVGDTRFALPVSGPYFDAMGVITGSPGVPCAIDANNVIWKNYLNCGNNAYWQRQARKT
jgi:hypothetical protein